MVWFGTVFDDWVHQRDGGHVSTWPRKEWVLPHDPSRTERPPSVGAEGHAYRTWLARREFTRENARIQAIGLWETVGSLGFPQLGILPFRVHESYRFVDTRIPKIVEKAFHALALDENRRPFLPTLWEDPDRNLDKASFKQVWFPGVHADVGGSYVDGQAANVTLAWMVQQLEPVICFDFAVVNLQYEQVEPASWGEGEYMSHLDLTFSFQFSLACPNSLRPFTRFLHLVLSNVWEKILPQT